MKTLLISLVLFIFLSPLLLAQEVGINGNGTNGWFFAPNAACSVDSLATGTFALDGFQVFNSYGNTSVYQGQEGDGCLDIGWYKNFWESYPMIPDTIAVDAKYLNGINTTYLVLFIAIEDSVYYWHYHYKFLELDSEWHSIFWDMAEMKTLMRNFYRIYLIFYLISEDSCYIGTQVAVDNLRGIDDTLGTVIYDNFDGPSGIVDIEQNPSDFVLEQNYPNPFNPSTTIRFTVPEREQVSLVIFNSLGQEIQTLVSEERGIGTYEVSFDASELPSGVYFYRLQTRDFVEIKKMLFLK